MNEEYPQSAPINYPDANRLSRKQKLPISGKIGLLIAVLIAFGIGGAVVYKAADTLIFAAERTEKQIQANISRDIDYQMPDLLTICRWSDSEILDYLQSTNGYSLYFFSTDEDYPDGGFDAMKLPSDVTLDEATKMLSKGISKMSATDASKLLNGSYRITVDLSDYHDVRVRYVDFKSPSYDAAIEAAIQAQGLTGDNCIVLDGGVDNFGNHFQSGVYDKDGVNIEWKISCVDLEDMYDIAGLPENAYFVGIRFVS